MSAEPLTDEEIGLAIRRRDALYDGMGSINWWRMQFKDGPIRSLPMVALMLAMSALGGAALALDGGKADVFEIATIVLIMAMTPLMLVWVCMDVMVTHREEVRFAIEFVVQDHYSEVQEHLAEIEKRQAELERYQEYYELHSGRVQTALYRYWDTDSQLLYVGIASNPSQRLAEHRRSGAPWVKFAAQTTQEWFPSRREAAAAERAAIETESPIFNTVHNWGATRRRAEYLAARESPTT